MEIKNSYKSAFSKLFMSKTPCRSAYDLDASRVATVKRLRPASAPRSTGAPNLPCVAFSREHLHTHCNYRSIGLPGAEAESSDVNVAE